MLHCGKGADSAGFQLNVLEWASVIYSHISFLGVRSDINELLHIINIFVLSSNFEALPISIIEAMSAGRVTIADLAKNLNILKNRLKNNHLENLYAI